jgi:hypothetical protein
MDPDSGRAKNMSIRIRIGFQIRNRNTAAVPNYQFKKKLKYDIRYGTVPTLMQLSSGF